MSISEVPLTETVFYMLLVLRKPRHGYGIVQEVAELTDGRVKLGPGTLYGALKTLTAKGWIHSVGGALGPRGKKEYEITDAGRAVLRLEIDRMREALQNAERLSEAVQTTSDEAKEGTDHGEVPFYV